VAPMVVSDVTRLVFGLVAAARNDQAAAQFEELAVWMRVHAGLDLQRNAASSYYDLASSVRQGQSDVAWLPPVAYAWLAEAVTPLGSIVRGGRVSYSSTLVVAQGSAFESVEELRGSRAGWVDPWSAAGYVVPRLELAKNGLDPSTAFETETFYGTHRDALVALRRGDCDFAGIYDGAWNEMEGMNVRVLATFGSIPPDVLVVRRNLAPAPYERALSAFRVACTDPAARPLVRAVFGGDELREGIEEGHATLRHAYERAVANGLFD